MINGKTSKQASDLIAASRLLGFKYWWEKEMYFKNEMICMQTLAKSSRSVKLEIRGP